MLDDEEKEEWLAAARSEALRRDFAMMRDNSAARAPSTVDDLLAFLAFSNSFGPPRLRLRPLDAGHCIL